MKNTSVLSILAASVAVASAQITYDNGTYTCAKPNAAYCAGDSLKTDIIIRCDSAGKGQPGRCSNNLAGEPPLGNTPALCWQTDANSGDAACEKNCVVYGNSGNANGTFTLPTDVCTPTYTASASATSSCRGCTEVPTTIVVTTETTICPSTTTTAGGGGGETGSSAPQTTPTTIAGTPDTGGGGETGTGTSTGTGTGSTGGSGSSSLPSSVSTNPPAGGSSTTAGPSSSSVVTGPTTTTGTPASASGSTTSATTVATAGAVVNAVGGAMALVGLGVAYLL